MKLTFLGAAGGVSGSCYVMETDGVRFAVDCGLHQGGEEVERRNWDMVPYRPKDIQFVLATHAHIDHIGLLPRLVKTGFSGQIHCTKATAALMDVMLEDSAHIQEMEAQWQDKKRRRKGRRQVIEPLYTAVDAEKTTTLLAPKEYGQVFEPAPGVKVCFQDAGHILGSAFVEVWIQNGDGELKIVFSGDIGRPGQLLMNDPSQIETADVLLMESTYGDRDHKDEHTSRDELAEAIAYSYRNGEKVIIPAFALERTQELLYALSLLEEEGRLPKDMPVFVDSPLAIKATTIFRQHPEYFDAEAQAMIARGRHPFDLPGLRFTPTAEDSAKINTLDGPAIVISASGMANAGRIKHHLRHNIWREGASVVIVGFQAKGTPGRAIVDGAESIRILGEDVAVRARVYTIGGFSAHAGQSQLMNWLSHFDNPKMRVFLTHGEPNAAKTLATLIRERYGFEVDIPEYLEQLKLTPAVAPAPRPEAAPAPEAVPVLPAAPATPAAPVLEIVPPPPGRVPHVDLGYLVEQARRSFEEVEKRLAKAQADNCLDAQEKADLRTRLIDVNSRLLELASDI